MFQIKIILKLTINKRKGLIVQSPMLIKIKLLITRYIKIQNCKRLIKNSINKTLDFKNIEI
jgi:hypothetical protein